ncbi:MAG: hypothetical protein LAO08_19110 [Acidobacteriia bacterium]|nr:hypothetical protein [Terriglobia bacterium]
MSSTTTPPRKPREKLKVTMKRIGFRTIGDCDNATFQGRLLCDPIISERRKAVLRTRRGYPNGRSINVMGDDDPASVCWITKHMTAVELEELHQRILTWHINTSTGFTEPPQGPTAQLGPHRAEVR